MTRATNYSKTPWCQRERSSSVLPTLPPLLLCHCWGRHQGQGEKQKAVQSTSQHKSFPPVSLTTRPRMPTYDTGRRKKRQCNSLTWTWNSWLSLHFFFRNEKIQTAFLVSDFKQFPPRNWDQHEIVISWREYMGVVWLKTYILKLNKQ